MKSIGQILCRMPLDVGSFDVFTLGLFVLGRNPTEARYLVLIYLMTGYIIFDYLIEGVSAGFLPVKLFFSP